MGSSTIRKTLLALSLGLGLSGLASTTAIAGPGERECQTLELRCLKGDAAACDTHDRLCWRWGPR
ncbi:hypothetical protein SG34_015990 [Thalassomonas viridans]|uniref:Uncharacterized protein n=1 Tax=Thalassomonas viridans TaxID=137584 RepID=A0AAE9Z0G2_9GAMM|nr:hypothetical protein [Thalassomonas viridans]WDE02942.1 hypothetical protein SG34_015990 [Thalassomonas viridans]